MYRVLVYQRWYSLSCQRNYKDHILIALGNRYFNSQTFRPNLFCNFLVHFEGGKKSNKTHIIIITFLFHIEHVVLFPFHFDLTSLLWMQKWCQKRIWVRYIHYGNSRDFSDTLLCHCWCCRQFDYLCNSNSWDQCLETWVAAPLCSFIRKAWINKMICNAAIILTSKIGEL